jgi:hypothetical protein
LCEARDIALIEDDIYGDIYFGAARPRASEILGPEQQRAPVFVIYQDAGTRVQCRLDCPGKLFPQVAMLKFISSVSTRAAWGGHRRFMANGGYDHHLRRLRAGSRTITAGVAGDRNIFPAAPKSRARGRLRAVGGAVGQNRRIDFSAARVRSASVSPRPHVHDHQALSQLFPAWARVSGAPDRDGSDAAGQLAAELA